MDAPPDWRLRQAGLPKMTRTTQTFFIVTVVTFLGFFVIEALLWPLPFVQALLLPQLNPGLDVPATVQGQVLRSLFINQGVYNLVLAIGGVAALIAAKRGDARIARIAVTFFSLAAVGAALTLSLSTHAYALAALQALFPTLTLVFLRREGRRAS